MVCICFIYSIIGSISKGLMMWFRILGRKYIWEWSVIICGLILRKNFKLSKLIFEYGMLIVKVGWVP